MNPTLCAIATFELMQAMVTVFAGVERGNPAPRLASRATFDVFTYFPYLFNCQLSWGFYLLDDRAEGNVIDQRLVQGKFLGEAAGNCQIKEGLNPALKK
jgi:hypothetical protein